MREDDRVRDAHELAAVGGGFGEACRRQRTVPLLDEAVAVLGVGRRERLHHAGERRVMAVAEGDGDGELAVLGNVDLAHDGDVAVERLTEAVRHPHMRGEVLIAIACADITAARAGEAAVSTEGERDVVLPGEHAALAGDIERAGGVAFAAAIEVRREQGVALEAGEDGLIASDLDVHQHDGMMRVGDELLGDRVAAAEVVGDDADGEGVVVDVVEVVLEVALLFVEEGLLVREEELHVPRLRAVDGGVIDLVERAVRGREPDAAAGRVGGADGVFFAGGPAGFQSRATKSGAIVVKPAVVFVENAHALSEHKSGPEVTRYTPHPPTLSI